MAITINQQPDTYSPVYNPLVFVVTSDNTAETNFNYIIDVYWNSTLQTRHRMPARPDNGKCVFDVSKILESQVTHDIDIETEDFTLNSNSYLKFQVKFGEEYDVAGDLTLFTDLTISNDIWAFNAALDYFDFVYYASVDYVLDDSSRKFLTNAPLSNRIRLTDNQSLYSVFSTSVANYNKQFYKVYNASGVVQNGGTPYSLVNSVSSAADKFIKVPVGPAILNSIFANIIQEGYTYETWAVQGSTQISEKRTFIVDTQCTKYTPYRLHFLNQLGGFDSFNFILASKEDSRIDRVKYKRLLGSMSGSSFVYSKTDRGENILSTTVTDSITINSNWISEEESVWLKELITSPIVFHELNGELLPISITDSKYEVKRRVTDKLFNLSLTFNYSVVNNRQRY